MVDVETSSVSPVVIDYPEFTTSVALSISVDVVGPIEMTYCSLITRMNLHRFTGLPASTIHGEQDVILQGDAIRLIEQGIQTQTFLLLEELAPDMNSYFGELAPYSLFDLYFYTPHPTEHLTEKDYFFQGHRVVLLYAQGIWWVMDPLRGSGDRGRQQWDDYKLFLDPSTYSFVYNQSYRFSPEFHFDLPEIENTTRTIQVAELGSLTQEGVIVSELDTAFMPLASSFLKQIKWVTEGIHTFISVGTVVRSLDNSPFNIGLLSTTKEILSPTQATISLLLPGKELSFSLPMNLEVDIGSLFPEDDLSEAEFVITKQVSTSDNQTICDDYFSLEGKKIEKASKGVLLFSACTSGTYTISFVPPEK